jgi:hypothetical protein
LGTKFPPSGLFILKNGMSLDTNVLQKSVAKVANLEGPEEDTVHLFTF